MERVAWERMIDEGEAPIHYRYFCEYRDTPIEKRSYDAIAEKFGIKPATVANISCEWNWKQRAAKYDDYVDKEARRLGLAKAERIRLKSLALSERMLNLAGERIEAMSIADLSPRETREYIKAAVALAEVFKDDQSKQRAYLENEDPSAEVVIYMPEIESEEGGD